MPLGILLNQLLQNERKTIRLIEKINKKIIHIKYSLVFNNTCIKENILPKYTNIRLHDPAARNQQFTVEYRKQLILRQIEIKSLELEEVELERNLKLEEL